MKPGAVPLVSVSFAFLAPTAGCASGSPTIAGASHGAEYQLIVPVAAICHVEN
jgi:hypothetical protein